MNTHNMSLYWLLVIMVSGAALGNLAGITVKKNKNKNPNTQPLDQELAVTTPAMPWLLTELVLNSKRVMVRQDPAFVFLTSLILPNSTPNSNMLVQSSTSIQVHHPRRRVPHKGKQEHRDQHFSTTTINK